VFAVGGYLVKDGNKRILKLCLAMQRRQWFEGLWGKSKDFDLPASFLRISNDNFGLMQRE
jgi:hypothetical protein